MAWVRLEDDFYDNDKFEYVGALGVALYVAALAYCNRNLTDGFIPKTKVRGLLDFEGIALQTGTGEHFDSFETEPLPLIAQAMLDAGLWHEQGHDCDGCPQPDLRKYVVHDYLRYQPSREKVERERAGSRERMAKSRQNRAQGSGDVAPQQDRNDAGSSPAPKPKPEGSKEPSGRRKAATPAPDILDLTEEDRAWAAEKAPLVDLQEATEEFLTWARSVDKRYADWKAAWRNAMKRQNGFAIRDGRHLRPVDETQTDLPDWMLA